ncbi:MAG: PKD domain-containing protein [Flavobacteriales bacterium]|nr:PKD domain-containing protein [Flavobacteriales bacterium]MDW8431163.1 PKD domain-containing protein [Flavobacteriales bacterium]
MRRFLLWCVAWALLVPRLWAQCPPTFTYTLNGLQVLFDNQPDWTFPQATVLWDFGDGASLTNVNNPIHTYAAPGTYTVCMTSIWSGCNGGAPQTTCQTIQVTGASCLYDFTFSLNGNTALFNNTPNVQAPANIFWDFGDGGWFNSNDPSHFYTMPGLYNACMTVNDPACGAQPIVVCHPVDLSAADTCQFSISQVTNGLSVQFFNSPVLPDSALVWDLGDGSLITGNNPLHTYWFPGDFYVCATAHMPQCFAAPIQSACDSVHISVPDSCVFTYAYQISGLTVSFQAQPPLTPPVNFYWDFGDLSGVVSGVNNPTHTFPGAGTYYVCLFADGLPCPDVPVWAHCEYITIGAPAPCTANFGYTINGLTVHFYHNPVIGSGAPFSLEWSFGDGATASGDYPQHTYAQPGTYVVCLTYTHPQCALPFVVCDTLVITGATNCEPLISHSVSGLTVQFQNEPDYPPGGSIWFEWIFGDGAAALYTNDPVHTYGGYGNYLPCFRVFDPHCSDTVQICDTLKLAPVGLSGLSASGGVHLFPNPVRDVLWIQTAFPLQTAVLEVYSTDGRRVAQTVARVSPSEPFSWPLDFLPRGVYRLCIREQSLVWGANFIKM